MSIRILSAHVANKIAAGEVVERPSSAMKELAENAIDAGATRIDVEAVAGGRKLIAVSDNGSGMNRDDALLSLERQATSKIQDVDDIERIATLGFRGEALPSIASVSRFRMVTCASADGAGTELSVSGGTIQDVRDTGAPQGTLVEVRDLFFNVPARRKFLRAFQTELSHIRMAFMALALSHPDVTLSLKSDGRPIWQLPGGTLADRLRDLFGAELMNGLKPVEFSLGPTVTGYAGIPSVARADRTEQFFFVNGRAAHAPVTAFALKEAYRGLLPSDRHAPVFLFLKMNPELVDVNVHPAKREVRFRQPGPVRDAIIQGIRQALGHPVALGIQPDEKALPERSGPFDTPMERSRPIQRRLTIENLPASRSFPYPAAAWARLSSDPAPGSGPAADSEAAKAAHEPETRRDDAEPKSPWAWCRVVGQIGGLYVVLETEDGYVVMDPHAAHERVQFERFMDAFLKGKVQTQGLLMPETVELPPRDALRVRQNIGLLREMGFGLSEFGGDAFVVDALPTCFSGASVKGLLVEVAGHLEQAGARGGKGRWREEAIAQAACKASVKARDRLSMEEIERLVVDLAGAEMPYTCPHGRPTLIYTSFKDLNRKFARE